MKKMLFILSSLLAACSYTYQPPEQGSSSNLRVLATDATFILYGIGFYTFSDDQCNGTRKLAQLGGMGCGNGETIGMPKYENYKPEEMSEMRIPAGKPFNIGIALGKSTVGHCFITAQFVPQMGRNYEAIVGSDTEKCELAIVELANEAGKIERKNVDSFKKNDKACTFFIY